MTRKIKALAALVGVFAAGVYLIDIAINAALHAFLFILTINN